MLAAMPAEDLAETLCVLAGPNAGNAARHFGKYSYDSGDVAGAIIWSQVAMRADLIAPTRGESGSAPTPPIPLRLRRQFEVVAHEDVTFAALAIEAPQIEPLPEAAAQEQPAPASAAMRSISVPPARRRTRGVYCHKRKSALALVGGAPKPQGKTAIRGQILHGSIGRRLYRLAPRGSALHANAKFASAAKKTRKARTTGPRLRRISLITPAPAATRRKASRR